MGHKESIPPLPGHFCNNLEFNQSCDTFLHRREGEVLRLGQFSHRHHRIDKQLIDQAQCGLRHTPGA